jgi:ferredoxin
MPRVRFEPSGIVTEAKVGETVLEVARREGIDIPALCHEEGMAAWGVWLPFWMKASWG